MVVVLVYLLWAVTVAVWVAALWSLWRRDVARWRAARAQRRDPNRLAPWDAL